MICAALPEGALALQMGGEQRPEKRSKSDEHSFIGKLRTVFVSFPLFCLFLLLLINIIVVLFFTEWTTEPKSKTLTSFEGSRALTAHRLI